MIYIENNVINLTRGDDATLSVSLSTDDGDEYTLGENEYLTFGVKAAPDDSETLLLIRSQGGSNVIVFSHTDTERLDVGFYTAEIELMTQDEKHVTVWPKLTGAARTSKTNWKNFCVMSEVVRE